MKKQKIAIGSVCNDNIQSMSDKPAFMSIFKQKKKEYAYLGLAGLIPAVIVLLIYMISMGGLHPIGQGSILILDMNWQYIYFFSALRNAIFGEGELLYSFSRSLGGEFLGIYAYYLASPLTYLVCLFPETMMQEFALFLMLLKSALCGMSMGYYLHKHSEKLNKLTIVAFSLLYSLCAYAVVYQSNTMWIDSLIWLPLLTLGIESLVKYGKFKLFTVSLVMTLVSNYYIGYMCCIYVLLYFFYYMYSYKDNFVNNPLSEEKHFAKSIVRIAIFSLIAILISAVIICSAYYSLSFGKSDFSDPNYDITVRVNFFDVLFKLFPGSYDTVRPTNFKPATQSSPAQIATGGFPFIYCGLITLLLLPVFFTSRKITLREKIGSGVFLGFFILSCVISTLDIMWHGFNEPQWLNNRYSFMLSFLMVVLAFKAFENIDEPSVKNTILFSALFFGGFSIVIQKLASTINEGVQEVNKNFKLGNFEFALFTVIMIVIYLVIVALMRSSTNKTRVSAILLGVISVELLLNGISNTVSFGKDVGYASYDKYDQFQNIMYPIADTVKDGDSSFYRWEKTVYRKTNENMQFGIRGLSNSTSTLDASTIQLLNTMGYAARAQWSIYLGGNPVSDSLLGIKYLITDRDMSEFYGEPVYTAEDFAKHEGMSVEELIEKTLADNSGSETYSGKSAADYVVYKNPYAMSIAFASSHDVIDFNMKKYNTYVKEDSEFYNDGGYTNPFERINALVTAILGEDETVELYKPATQESITYSKDVEHTISGDENDAGHFHHKYTGANGKVYFNYTVPADKTLYLYLPAYYTRQVKISASHEIADGTNNYNSSVSTNPTTRIVELGSFGESELVSKNGYNYRLTVSITGDKGEFYVEDMQSYIYYIDTELLAEVTSKLQENQLNIEKHTESSFEGTLKTNCDKQLILTTIPYDSAWEVTVDGVKVDVLGAIDTTPGDDSGKALLAFEIENAGEHNIEMVYKPKIIIMGAIVSGCTLLVFIAWIVFEKKLRKIGIYRKVFCIEDNSPKQEETPRNKLKSKFSSQNNRKD